jgi:hypothetical protein
MPWQYGLNIMPNEDLLVLINRSLTPSMLGLILLLNPIAHANPPDTEPHWRLELGIQSRLNPEGLSLAPRLGYRAVISDSNHLLLRGTYVEFGLDTPISPASFHPGVYVTVVPIAPIVLNATVRQLRYFGLFGNLGELEGPNPEWSDDARDTGITDGDHGTGYQASVSATLRILLGRFVAMSKYTRTWIGADVDRGVSWYDPTEDLLYGRNDGLSMIDATVGGFVMGTATAKRFLLAAGHWKGQWTDKSEQHRQLAGGLLIWRPGWWAERKLTFVTLLATYAVDPYREGGVYYGGVVKLTWERLP